MFGMCVGSLTSMVTGYYGYLLGNALREECNSLKLSLLSSTWGNQRLMCCQVMYMLQQGEYVYMKPFLLYTRRVYVNSLLKRLPAKQTMPCITPLIAYVIHTAKTMGSTTTMELHTPTVYTPITVINSACTELAVPVYWTALILMLLKPFVTNHFLNYPSSY